MFLNWNCFCSIGIEQIKFVFIMEKFNLRYLKPNSYFFLVVVLVFSLYVANEFILTNWGVSFSIFAVIGGIFAVINSYLWNVRPFS